MELKEFIKTAVSDITNAVSDLKDELQNGTFINPTLSHGQTSEVISIEGDVRKIERINFDIAVVLPSTHVKTPGEQSKELKPQRPQIPSQ